jgi:general stress protein 26
MRTAVAVLLQLLLAVPSASRAQGTTPAPPDRAKVIAAARDVMQVTRFATFITIGDDGQPQARVVDPFAPEPDLTVWIATNPLTRKVAEIRRDSRVTMLYFNAAAQEYVTLHGMATLVTDSAEKARRWKPEWAPLYKEGPRGDGYRLVRIRPSRLEFMSPRHGLMNDPSTWRPVIIAMP